ncbi:MAG: fumarate reductase, partial [Betaproteobacteria bacterium RBG_16_64_9]
METYPLRRDIPVEEGYDLVVAGGGPGGSAAAVCAARLGAKVLLVEATGCLGGMGTSGLVSSFGPVSDGERMLVGGFMKELCEKMYERGDFGPHVVPDYLYRTLNRWVPFKPEALKRLLDDLAVQAGVDVRFFTRVIDADADPKAGRVNGVILSNIEGYRYVRAKTYVDATGDATLSSLAGAACRVIERDIKDVAPSTLCSLYAGINWDHPYYGTDYRGVEAAKREVKEKILQKAVDEGHFSQADRMMPGMNKIGRTTAQLNAGHVFNLNGLSCRSLSEGMIFARKLAVEYTEFFRKYVPGCEEIEHLATAPVMGVRDSRRIVGEFELTLED